MADYSPNAWGWMLTDYDDNVDPAAKGVPDYILCRMGGTEDARPGDAKYDLYTDSKYNQWVQLAYDWDIPCMAFWNIAPRYWLKPSLQYTQKLVSGLSNEKHPILQEILKNLRNGSAWKNGKSLQALYFDIEEYSFNTELAGISENWITFMLSDLADRLQYMIDHFQMPEIQFGVYGRQLFFKDRVPSLDVFLQNHPNWHIFPAEWLSGVGGTDTLAKIKTVRPPYLIDDPAKPGQKKVYIPRLFGWTDKRAKQWMDWQYLGDATNAQTWKSNQVKTATGGARPICAMIHNGTPAQLRADFKYTPHTGQLPPVDPPPTTDVQAQIAALAQRVTALETQLAGYPDALRIVKSNPAG